MSIKIVKIDTSFLRRKIALVSKFAPVEPKKILQHQMQLLLKELTEKSINPSMAKAKIGVSKTIGMAFRPWRGGAGVIVNKRYRQIRGGDRSGKKIPTKLGVLKEFLKKQQSHIGILAAGWLGGGNPLKVKVKSQISKQKVYGSYEEIDNQKEYTITVTNQVCFARKAFNGYYPRIVQKCIDMRSRMLDAMFKQWVRSGSTKYKLPGSLK